MKPLVNRSIRFLRMWRGRAQGSVATPADLGYGQRDTLVANHIAEWVDEPKQTQPRTTRRFHKESVT